ncbi:MAG: hypothetical protein KJO07_12455 [Deltaproteobacteria bacterium]|nr:hypothetical protein [Deltaproteobacteria bacterium]
MARPVLALLVVSLSQMLVVPASGSQGDYQLARSRVATDRARLAAQLGEPGQRSAIRQQARRRIEKAVFDLSRHWLGTRWALGAPQTNRPGVGKVNCGTFVGRILRDAGFVVRVKKLQRQPSALIIKSFVGGKRVRKFSNASMSSFLRSVRQMGPGVFIVGLDFHVGFLIQTERDLRFVHASYVTHTVVDEPAATAVPIVTSKYRVVGKLLSNRNIDDWLLGRRIRVKGRW